MVSKIVWFTPSKIKLFPTPHELKIKIKQDGKYKIYNEKQVWNIYSASVLKSCS